MSEQPMTRPEQRIRSLEAQRIAGRIHGMMVFTINQDGPVKSPLAAIRLRPRHGSVPSVRFIPRASHAVSRTFFGTVCKMTFYESINP